jgi:hypothetical protein
MIKGAFRTHALEVVTNKKRSTARTEVMKLPCVMFFCAQTAFEMRH